MELGRERPRSPTHHLRPAARERGSLTPHCPCPPCPEKCVSISARIAARFRPRSSGRSGHELPDGPRLEYAVDLMVVLRCTQSLLLRLKQFDDAPDVRSTTKLGDWYGNLIWMGNRHVLLFISERSRLPIMIPVREANRLRSSFPDAVCHMLAAVGFPQRPSSGSGRRCLRSRSAGLKAVACSVR
jgi:hypothetical protein